MTAIGAKRSIGFLLLPGYALMSYAAAVEPLRAANQISCKELYRWWNASPGNEPATSSCGAAVLPNLSFGSTARIDLMLVCAGGNPTTFDDRKTFSWLRRLDRSGVRIGGISGGPFVIARAGLLKGRRCTLHWEHLPAFEEEFLDVETTRSLFEIDGNRITCSGGIAALDMMISIIGADHGHSLAAAVSDWFLHTQVREGTGPQRMDLGQRLGVGDQKLITILTAMEKHLERPLSRQQLARHAGLSVRQLERTFKGALKTGVHEHYLGLRLDRSRQLLREASLSVTQVAAAMGFASASHFARAFRRRFGISPSQSISDRKF